MALTKIDGGQGTKAAPTSTGGNPAADAKNKHAAKADQLKIVAKANTQSVTPLDKAKAALANDHIAQAVLSLPADQREKYSQLRAQLAPDGQQALDAMLTSGKLEQKDLSHSPSTLLDHLSLLSTEPLAKGLDRAQLLDQATLTANDPTQIFQSDRDTCGATTFEYMLATRNASEFVRLLAGISGQSGQVQTMTGSTLSRDPNSIAMDDSGRSIPDRLMQSAFMKYGRGLLGYDNKLDGNHWYSRVTSGLTNGMFLHLDSGVLGEHRHTAGHFWDMLPLPFLHHDGGLVTQIQQATASGQVVPVSVNFNGSKSGPMPGGHFLLVTKVENGRVYFRNPWGTEASPGTMLGTDGQSPLRRAEANGLESMTRADFEHILVQGELPDGKGGSSSGLLAGVLPQVHLPGPLSILDAPVSIASTPLLAPLSLAKKGLSFLGL